MRKDPVTKEDKMHKGVDFSAKTGTPVIATASGAVEKVEFMKGGYGKYIQIKHDDQYQTLYAQLSEMNVQVGDKVEKGQLIGKVGNTGMSTGPHLHYEVIKNGEKVDPKDYYDQKINSPAPKIITWGLARDEANQKKYGLKENHHMVNFGLDFKYHKIVYDDEKAVFFNGEETFVKMLNELSQEQVESIKALRLPPPPPPMKRQPIPAIVENWTDPTIYGIWIDGKKVDNSVMINYKASDFSHHSKSNLYRDAKKGKIYTYQLNLTTNEKYEKDKIRAAQQKAEWEKTTKASLAKLDF